MTPWLRRFPLASFLALGATLVSEPGRAEVAPELVVVAEPAASDALAASEAAAAVTLAYRVVEVFSGEPGSASVVVRHDALTPEDRARLAAGERVILLARRDPADDARWVASAPLRATPSAVAAFRAWSAPEDVRAARPVADVVAEVSHAPTSSEAVPRRVDLAVAEKAPAAPGSAPVSEHARPEPPFAPAPETAGRSERLPAEPHAEAPEQETAMRQASPDIEAASRAEPGPGLPPPPTSRVLGPAPEDRSDLKPPRRQRR